jgi:hypothetical protein
MRVQFERLKESSHRDPPRPPRSARHPLPPQRLASRPDHPRVPPPRILEIAPHVVAVLAGPLALVVALLPTGSELTIALRGRVLRVRPAARC